jgi:hypothetical protein
MIQKIPRRFFAPVIAGIFTLLLYSCATSPKTPPLRVQDAEAPEAPPLWVRDAEAVYPAETYIAQKGYGGDRARAELSGLEAISRYFASEVSSTLRMEESYTERDGAVSSAAQFDEQIFVQSQTRLFAVRYTTPWYNPQTEVWETLAFIDRGEAWAVYEPRLRDATGAFWSVYQAAEKEQDPLKQYILYTAAARERDKAGNAPDMLEFAQILNPGKARAWQSLRDALPQAAVRAASAKDAVTISISCPEDYNALIYTALSNAINAQGFKAQREEGGAERCTVAVSENAQTLEAGTFYTPALTITINGRTGPVFSYSANISRQGARDPAIARQRAYTAVAAELQKTFREEFSKSLLRLESDLLK